MRTLNPGSLVITITGSSGTPCPGMVSKHNPIVLYLRKGSTALLVARYGTFSHLSDECLLLENGRLSWHMSSNLQTVHDAC